MSSATFNSSPLAAARFQLSGVVQGVGMRPMVARLAETCSLTGFVRNDGSGVEIHVEGSQVNIEAFAAELQNRLPPAAQIHQQLQSPATVSHADAFLITQSDSSAALMTAVPLDLAICPVCRADVLDASSRRHNYPFVTCTDCGPRYSLIQSMPFDRNMTSMHAFQLCTDCANEYCAPEDRRFHAQTNACPACGPQLSFVQYSISDCRTGRDAIVAAAEIIRNGGIVAMKSVGGYQLICDATCTASVERLRVRKHRPTKPLAVMVRSVADAELLANVSCVAKAELLSPRNPIVLVRSLLTATLSPAINPDMCDVGIILPTSPLHEMLLREVGHACVVTSGNINGLPLAFRNDEAIETLDDVADGWLHHDRNIVRPIDDSVVRIVADLCVTIRAARGLTPMSLKLHCEETILATGAHQKVAIALSNGYQSVLGPHVGDMDSVGSRQRFVDHVRQFCELYQTQPAVIAHDLHPDYFTTRWAADQNVRTIAVQHHHAHTVAGMLENDWLEHEVLGVCFDGTGFGTDGTIWGGEFLICAADRFHRVARLRPFPLLGGERAIREPGRIAAALLHEVGIDFSWPVLHCGWSVHLDSAPGCVPLTSSVGRLFDGVAALVLGIAKVSFEGEAAMQLEAVCERNEFGQYDFPICNDGLMELDWRPMVRQIVNDLQHDIPAGIVATKFTRSIASAVARICVRFTQLPVVLSGGCFQNAILTELTAAALESHPMPIGLPGKIPPNDGGLAAGQLAIAQALLQHGKGGV